MISVVIVNWNTREFLRNCLHSLHKFPPCEAHEIIVIDNASADESAKMVAECFPEVKLLSEPINRGYAQGNNIGFRHAIGDLILTLNPDTELSAGALDKSAKVLREHSGWGALGARLISNDGTTQKSIRCFPTYQNILGDILGLERVFPTSPFGNYRGLHLDYEQTQTVDQPMGTFLMFKRQALRAIGDANAPFDPQFPIFFNEVDLLLRLKESGWSCGYSPEIEVLHHGGASTKQVKKSMIWESHRSLIRYFKKHHTHGLRIIGYPFLAAAATVGAYIRAKGTDAGFTA